MYSQIPVPLTPRRCAVVYEFNEYLSVLKAHLEHGSTLESAIALE